jgi:hypothetical protein
VVSSRNSIIGRGRPNEVLSQLEGRVAQVGAADVGQEGDAVHAEVVVAVADLGDRTVHVRGRQRREQAEPAGMRFHSPMALFVDLASEITRRAVVTEVNARR